MSVWWWRRSVAAGLLIGAVGLAVPVAAQDAATDPFPERDFPMEVRPGSTITLSGTVGDQCSSGTTEVGWDPAPDFEDENLDYRSGLHVGVRVPDQGEFSVELTIPADADGGHLYITCESNLDDYLPVWVNWYSAVETIDDDPTTAQPTTPTVPSEPDAVTDDMFAFRLARGTGALTISASSHPAPGMPALDLHQPLAAGPLPGSSVQLAEGPLAVRVPRATRCDVWTCLWGYFAPPYYGCNQTVVTANFGRSRYGSMTAYGYARKGKADYLKARPLFYQDGQLIKTGDWERLSFSNPIGQAWEAWTSLRLHQQFASPNSQYQVGFQAQWWDDVAWGSDRMLATTSGAAVVPYVCVAGP